MRPAMLNVRGTPGIRVLNGLFSLKNKHPAAAINSGCAKALDAQEFSFKGLQKQIEAHSVEQQNLPFMDKHPLIHSTAEYEQHINSKGLFK